MGKKDLGIVGETVKNAYEVDAHKRKQEVAEGVEAEGKIKELQRNEEQKRQEIESKYLDGMPYELERVVGETKAFLQQTVMGIIEAGKRLIAMKEFEKYGEWEKIIEQKIGISRITAWRFMAIARKLSVVSRVKQLAITGIGDGIGKLYALLNVTEEELAEFDETGMFKGATVDDLNKMTAKDIRKLIAEKEDLTTKTKQLELQLAAKYDTNKQWNEKIAKKEEMIKRLNEQIDDANMPLDDKEAIRRIEKLKTQLRGIIRILECTDAKKYGDEVQAELVLAMEYAHDRSELGLSRVLESVRGTLHRPGREETEENFQKGHSDEED